MMFKNMNDMKAMTKVLRKILPTFRKCKNLELVNVENKNNGNELAFTIQHSSGHKLTLTVLADVKRNSFGYGGWVKGFKISSGEFVNVLWNPKTTRNDAEGINFLKEELDNMKFDYKDIREVDSFIFGINRCTVSPVSRDLCKVILMNSMKNNHEKEDNFKMSWVAKDKNGNVVKKLGDIK